MFRDKKPLKIKNLIQTKQINKMIKKIGTPPEGTIGKRNKKIREKY